MPITELLRQNAERYPDDTSLVEITPPPTVHGRLTWKEYALIESGTGQNVRREITWKDFNCQANRFANFLLSRGIRKGEKVAILLMNCLEWLPIYFGILKAGAIAVPLNYRYTAEEIRYCLNLAEADFLVLALNLPDGWRKSAIVCLVFGACCMSEKTARHLQKAMTV